MRVAIVSESFLPQINGVTNSVLRVCEQLQRRGHEVLVVAPGPGPSSCAGARVIRTPSVPLPGYRDFRLGRPWAGMTGALEEFAPDVVHLASPAVLGAQEALASGVPVVAPAAGGLLDLVQHDVNGLHFLPGSAGSLRTAVDALRDDGRRRRLTAAARPSVAGRTWDVIGDQLVRHYEQVA